MAAGRWPTGIRPRGRGLHVRIWQRGTLVYQTTLECDPFDPASLAAAVEHREKKLARLKLGLPLRSDSTDSPIFSDVASRWLASKQISKRQIRKYHQILNARWMPLFASWPINEITTAHIQEAVAGFGVSVKTQKNYVDPLRGTLRHGGMNPNPCNGIEWPSQKRTSRRKMRREKYSIDERDRILKRLTKLSEHHRALAEEKPTQKNLTDAHWSAQAAWYFHVFFGIGARPGEILALDHAKFDGQFVWIETQHTDGEAIDMTKTGVDRRVYVPQSLRPHFTEHPGRFAGGLIMRGYQGGPLHDTKRLNPWWKLAHEKEHIRLRDPYCCRHNRASELLSQGVDPAEGAYQLGHSVPMFTELYGEFIEEYAKERDWSRFETATASKTAQTPHRIES